jgi:RNA polymerase sigma-70 factor, ECF subfamily
MNPFACFLVWRVQRNVPQLDTLTGRSDEELMARFQAGDMQAFGVLVRRYERELYGYLRRYLGDGCLAEDVFQNTFLQLHLKRGQYEVGRRVRPWLYTIATHQAVDALRRNGRHQAVSLEQTRDAGSDGEADSLSASLESRCLDPFETASGNEQAERVRAAVELLPGFLKQVLILAYYQGMKYREVAEIMGIPVGTVKSRLHAALVKLQESMSEAPAVHEA